jgi:hypothetical protein
VITERVNNDIGRKGKGRMANMCENMINACVGCVGIAIGVSAGSVPGKEMRVSTGKGSIHKGLQNREQVRPGALGLWGKRGTTIAREIWITVPVADEKVIRSIKRGLGRELFEKINSRSGLSWGVKIGNAISLPLEAKCRG